MPRSIVTIRSSLLTTVALLLGAPLLTGTATAGAGGGLADEDRAKQADKCQTEITGEGVKFVENKLKKLAKCADEIMECVQEEDDESVDGCIDKATGKCDKELAKIFDKDEIRMRDDILKKCVDEDLDFDDLMNPLGLGFEAHASLCADDFGTTLADPNDVAACVVAHNECLTERLFRVQAPRALELMQHASVDAGLLAKLSCLEGSAGSGAGFGNTDPKDTGKPIVKCHKEIEKRTRTFIKKKLKSIEKCTGDIFECEQEDPGDQKCIDKAIGKCDKEFGPDGKIAKEEGKLREKVAKKCDADEVAYTDLRGMQGLHTDDLDDVCAARGVKPLDDLDQYTECLFRETECLVDEIMRIQTPRLLELMVLAGRETEVPPAYCFTPDPNEFAIVVTKLGDGEGTIVSDPPGIHCGDTCAASFPPGNVKLIASTTNGSDARFDGWGGDRCEDAGIERECGSFVLDENVFVDASFVQQEANLIFQTAETFALTLGNAAAYDAECNTSATAAGVNNATNDGFSAWVTEQFNIAPDRLGTARGWVRLDGKPFADDIADLKADEVFNPVFYQSDGSRGLGVAATGAIGNGNRGGTCDGWTNAAGGAATAGSAFGGPKVWTFSPTASCNSLYPVYCLGTSKTIEIDPPPTAGKLLYVSTTPLSVGTDPDTHCENEKPAGAGTVKALVARTTAAADTHLDAGTTYVRPDGQVIATGAELVTVAGGVNSMDPQLTSGPWQRGDGSYIGVTMNLWTGQDNMTDVGTLARTCDDWTNSGGTGYQGTTPSTINGTFWDGVDGVACSLPRSIYCVEQ